MAFPAVDYAWCVVVMAVLTGIYVIIGGYMATAVNDFIQGLIMLGGIVAVIVLFSAKNGGFTESVTARKCFLPRKRRIFPVRSLRFFFSVRSRFRCCSLFF